MKKSFLLISSLMFIAVLTAGCIGSGNPTPTITAMVSPTIMPTATVTSPSITVLPLPTTVKIDTAIDKQASYLISQWVQNNYGWNNATFLKDVTFSHKDGDDYIYTFTVSGGYHTANIAYSDGQFSLAKVDNEAPY
ncbi:MAG TPA: hypothetical protein VGK13_07155 [Methanocellaceae archaeon]|jgi:hypothetical protein